MSKRRNKGKKIVGWGESKHRTARMKRFAAQHQDSRRKGCFHCHQAIENCTCKERGFQNG